MLLLTEYLVRTGAVKEMLQIPCSFFLTERSTGDKKAVTIADGYNTSDLVVKHWLFGQCFTTQVLPSIKEFTAPRSQIFYNQNIILENHDLLDYEEEPAPIHLNSIQHPMPESIYHQFFDHLLNTSNHKKKKTNWLWKEFTRIYCPDLYINRSLFLSEQDYAESQRDTIQNFYPEKWLYWLKWRKYILDFQGIPGELIFLKEYNL